MAVIDVASSAQISGSLSLSWSHTCTGSNGALGVGVARGEVAPPTSVTYNAVAMSSETSRTLPVDFDNTSLWKLEAPATGSNTVQVTAPSAWDIIAGALSVTDADQTDCTSNNAVATGSGTTPSVTCTSATGEIVLAVVCAIANATSTAGTGETEQWDLNGTTTTLSGHGFTEAGAASVTIAPTLSASSEWGICAMSFRSAPASTTIFFPRRCRPFPFKPGGSRQRDQFS